VTTTFVLGLGNVLMGDDGFGPYVIRAFEGQYELGAGAEAIDLGTPGLDLTPWLGGARHVVIVDTIRASDPPASSATFRFPASARTIPA
jgi:hydrogenase maturation protease